MSVNDLQQWQRTLLNVHCSGELLDYVQRLIGFTRDSERIQLGLSPRGGLAIVRAARCYACMQGRDYVTPDDVQAVFPAVVGHRLRAGGDSVDLATGAALDTGSLCHWILESVNVLPA
jgi:MoxR-like ATPase